MAGLRPSTLIRTGTSGRNGGSLDRQEIRRKGPVIPLDDTLSGERYPAAMADAGPLPTRMTADEFLRWAMDRPETEHWELHDGEPVAMAPERAEHFDAKGEVFAVLREQIRARGLPCRAYTEGASVRIDDHTSYEPDALVRCGPPLPRGTMFVDDPVVVVEVLSPSTALRDLTVKREGYFRLASVRHYLVLDPERQTVTHFRRDEAGTVRVDTVTAPDTLTLDPPGLTVAVAELFPQG